MFSRETETNLVRIKFEISKFYDFDVMVWTTKPTKIRCSKTSPNKSKQIFNIACEEVIWDSPLSRFWVMSISSLNPHHKYCEKLEHVEECGEVTWSKSKLQSWKLWHKDPCTSLTHNVQRQWDSLLMVQHQCCNISTWKWPICKFLVENNQYVY